MQLDLKLYHCRLQELLATAGIEPESVDLVFTDIPYGKAFLPELGQLAGEAERWLRPGGLFVTYSGQYYLDRVMAEFGRRLTYRWVGSTVWWTLGVPVHPLNTVSKWKPLVVFSKGVWEKRQPWVDYQFNPSEKEKEWHPWQQPLLDTEHWLRCFSRAGDLVVDPCGGGFTTAVGCLRLGRRFVGCDVDAGAVSQGRKRVELAQTHFESQHEE